MPVIDSPSPLVARSARLGAAVLIGLLAVKAALPDRARANPEAAFYDIRSLSLGGSGVAYLEAPAALAINPANLAGVEGVATSLQVPVAWLHGTVPLEGQGSRRTTRSVGALPSAYLAGQVHDRVVVGGGLYIPAGFGSRLRHVSQIHETPLEEPTDLEMRFFSYDLAAGAGVRLGPAVDLGVALRLPFAHLRARQLVWLRHGEPVLALQRLRGVGTPAVRLGLTVRPGPALSLGISYRSPALIPLEGHMRVPELSLLVGDSQRATSRWHTPHMVQLGAAVRLWEHRVLVTADYRFQRHRPHNESLELRVEIPEEVIASFLGRGGTEIPLEWRDVHALRSGVEVGVAPRLSIRAGLMLFGSASPPRTTQFFTPPPGRATTGTLGAGLDLAPVTVDLAFTVSGGGARVEDGGRCTPTDAVRVGCPGDYAIRVYTFGLGLTFHARPADETGDET